VQGGAISGDLLDIVVDRPDQRTDVAERPFANEIVPKPTQLDELGLDRFGPPFRVALASPFLVPGLRGGGAGHQSRPWRAVRDHS
jgi:hypothetical protein